MSESLGTRLRQRREEQGIALVTIAQDTKIKLSLLEALERDDVTQWPSGIFRRAYIRTYAQAIGLSPDAVVREFLETYPDPEEVIAAAARAHAAEQGNGHGGPARLRHLMGSALGSLTRLRRSTAVSEPPTASAPAEISAEPEDAAAVATWAPDPVPSAEPATGARACTDESLAVAPDPLVAPASEPSIAPTAESAVAPTPGPRAHPDYADVARLCTAFARVESPADAQALLGEAARILDAAGVIVWIHDDIASELRPGVSHGYSPKVLAQIPPVTVDDDHATAAAFRSGELRAVTGGADMTGALAVPLPTPDGCGGVLALELQHGGEQTPSVRAAATILAAMLGQLVGERRTSETEVRIPALPPAPLAIPFRAMARR